MTVVELIEILARYEPGIPVKVADAEGLFDATRLDIQVVDAPEADGGLALCISAHDSARARQVRPEVRCARCGWVHIAIPLHHAEQEVLDANTEHARTGHAPVETIGRYFRCYRCGAASDGFIAAVPSDAPVGSTLQPVVIAPRRFGRG